MQITPAKIETRTANFDSQQEVLMLLGSLAIAKEAIRRHAEEVGHPVTRADYDAVEPIAWTLYRQSGAQSPFDLVQDHLWVHLPEAK